MENVRNNLQTKILEIVPHQFDDIALELFNFQYKSNPIYKQWVDLLGVDISKIDTIGKIPFLPIQFFKSNIIKSLDWKEEKVFSSSGTTGSANSKHFIRSLDWYHKISKLGFEHFYSYIKNYSFFALLPSYLEREGSSLIEMIHYFIELSGNQGGFFLYNHDDLIDKIQKNISEKPLLIGVTYALLDLAEKDINLKNCIVMETGGMKGRRKEMVRPEVHELLSNGLNVNEIHSEYGMTELLSQAYSMDDGKFQCTPTMKVLLRDSTDPFTILTNQKSGLINVIDLGNIDSCAFIATDDIGIIENDGKFKIMGRLDGADIRGCNLMIS